MSRKLVRRDTKSLKLHPLLERVALMPEVMHQLQKQKVKKPEHREAAQEICEDWEAFKADIGRVGIQEPLKIVGDTIYDGRHRWLAAQELEFDTVPCEEVTEEEGRRLIESTIAARRHFTKGMRAYFAVLMHPEVVQDRRGGDRKSSGAKSKPTESDLITRPALAVRFGVSHALLDQACKLYEAFEQSKTLRERHEKLVWAGFGLGGIIAGLHGAERTERAIQDHELVNGIFKRLNSFGGALSEDWERFDAKDHREVITDAVTNFLARLPDPLRKAALHRLPSWHPKPESAAG